MGSHRKLIVEAMRGTAHRDLSPTGRREKALRAARQVAGGRLPAGAPDAVMAAVEAAHQRWASRLVEPPLLPAREQRARDEAARSYARAGYRECQGRWVEGDTHFCLVAVARPGEDMGIQSWTDRAWSRNGKWSTTTSHHRLRVPIWYPILVKKGIALVDGMMTLSARRVPSLGKGVEVYAASWIKQGRGTSLVQENGFIARLRPEAPWAHGSTAEQALLVSLKRHRAASKPAPGEAFLSRYGRRVVERAKVLSLAEQGVLGACRSGIEHWLELAMPGRDRATVAEVLAAAEAVRPSVSPRLVLGRVLRHRAQAA